MSQLIQKAILKMTDLHNGRVRKGDGKTPYSVHPLEVAMLFARFVPQEWFIAGALLHDALEDAGCTYEQLTEEFGEGAASLVQLVTEDRSITDYWERKAAAVERAKSHAFSMTLKAIDALVNMKDLIALLKEKGEKAWQVFNGSKELKLAYFRLILDTGLSMFHPELLADYVSALKDLEYAELQAGGTALGFNS